VIERKNERIARRQHVVEAVHPCHLAARRQGKAAQQAAVEQILVWQ